jgi:hypothetical protein
MHTWRCAVAKQRLIPPKNVSQRWLNFLDVAYEIGSNLYTRCSFFSQTRGNMEYGQWLIGPDCFTTTSASRPAQPHPQGIICPRDLLQDGVVYTFAFPVGRGCGMSCDPVKSQFCASSRVVNSEWTTWGIPYRRMNDTYVRWTLQTLDRETTQ